MKAGFSVTGVNRERCIDCGKCILDCPHTLFFTADTGSRQGQIVFEDSYDRCIRCGHCIAVCPTSAVDYDSEEQPLEFPHADAPQKLLSFEALMRVMRARRSVRRFKGARVPEEAIDAVLQSMRYAPTASNAQSGSYIVITDPEVRRLLVGQTMRMFLWIDRLMAVAWLIRPFVSKALKRRLSPGTKRALAAIIDSYRRGGDPVLHGAPCVVILHSPSYGHQADVDAGIALAHGMLAAQAKGLGTCLIGFMHESLNLFGSLRRAVGIPRGQAARGVMVLGYPGITYHRAPMREPLRSTRLG